MMCERAVSRTTKGQLLIEKQMIQDMIAESSADIRALRLLALHSAWVWDNLGASRARVEVAEIKFWGARVEALVALNGVKEAKDGLLAATKDADARVRARAIAALSATKDPSLADTYLPMLSDQSYNVCGA